MTLTPTDIDRLHAVVQGDRYGRGAGNTFAQCHELAAAIHLTTNGRVFCQFSDREFQHWVAPMLRRVLEEQGLIIQSNPTSRRLTVLRPDGSTVVVIMESLARRIPGKLAGLDCPYVEIH